MRGTIEIVDVEGSNPPTFDVRARQMVLQPADDGSGIFQQALSISELASGVAVPAPAEWPIPNDHSANLMTALPWYLESYLHDPTKGSHLRASFVQKALFDWGSEVFTTLLPEGAALDFFDHIALHALTPEGAIEIHSSRPEILGWPWEALIDNRGVCVGNVVTIRRHYGAAIDGYYMQPVPLESSGRPLRVLMFVSRSGPDDVSFRIGARAIASVEGVELDLVRSSTIAGLCTHIAEAAAPYDVLHIDCHGVWDPQRQRCVLQLLDENGRMDLVDADVVAAAVDEGEIPIVVLNACRSAMVGSDGEAALDSFATLLLESGRMTDVLAMAYKYPVAAIASFASHFYSALARGSSIAEAVTWGSIDFLDVAANGAMVTIPSMDALTPDIFTSGAAMPVKQSTLSLNFAGGRCHHTWLIPSAYTRRGLIPSSILRTPFPSERPRPRPDFHGQEKQLYYLDRCDPDERTIAVTGAAGFGISRLLQEWAEWHVVTGSPDTVVLVDCEQTANWGALVEAMATQLDIEPSERLMETASSIATAVATGSNWFIWDHADRLPEPDDIGNALLLAIKQAPISLKLIVAFNDPTDWMRELGSAQGILAWLEPDARSTLLRYLVHEAFPSALTEEARAACLASLETPEAEALLQQIAGCAALTRWAAQNIAEGVAPALLHQNLRDAGPEELRGFAGKNEIERLLARLSALDHANVAPLVPLLALHHELLDWELVAEMASADALGLDAEAAERCRNTLRAAGLLCNETALHPIAGGGLRQRAAASTTDAHRRAFASIFADPKIFARSDGKPQHITFGSLISARSILIDLEDWQPALDISGQLYSGYIGRGALADAINAARQTPDLFAAAPPPSQARALLDAARVGLEAGDGNLAQECLDDDRLVAPASGDRNIGAERLFGLGKLRRLQGDREGAIGDFEAALARLADETPPSEFSADDGATGQALLDEISREIRITRTQMKILNERDTNVEADDEESGYITGTPAELRERSLLAAGTGKFRLALTYIDRALAKERAAGYDRGIAVCLSSRAGILAKMGKMDAAREEFDGAVRTFNKQRDARGAATANHQWGVAAYDAGLMEEAAEQFVTAAKGFNALNDTMTLDRVARSFEKFLSQQHSAMLAQYFAMCWTAAGLPRTDVIAEANQQFIETLAPSGKGSDMNEPSSANTSSDLQRLRQAITRSGFSAVGVPEPSVEMRARIEEALLHEADSPAPASATDLTAAALTVLESDPDLTGLLDGSVSVEAPRDFSTLPEILTATTAAMLVLSSYVELERDKSGRWKFRFIIKPQTDKMKTAILGLARSVTRILPGT